MAGDGSSLVIDLTDELDFLYFADVKVLKPWFLS